MANYIKLTIDGIEVRAKEGSNIVQAAANAGIDIPTLCHYPGLEEVASCRMCIVEIEGRWGFITACNTMAEEGMVVLTETPDIIKRRRNILRLLLDNHPNDCLTCQKAGECELQNLAFRYEVPFRDHDGARRGENHAYFNDTSSPYILRDESKCILCGRCVRSCAQVEGRAVLSFAERGFNTHIAADANQTLEESTCVSCNRCVSVCPVGALLDRRAYGKFRSWTAEKTEVTCNKCDFGCKMEILSEKGERVAVRAKDPAAGRPLCLEGRLTTEVERLKVEKIEPAYEKTLADGERVFKETTWRKALGLDRIMDKVENLDQSKDR